ncbi:MAG: hypothetical protein WBF13_00100 [Candidatus Zixiibacteriota bacterium]
MGIFGTKTTLRKVVLWVLSVIIVGGVGVPLLTDTVRDWRRDYLQQRNVADKKRVLEQRQSEDLEVWEDTVRIRLDAQYAPELKRLREKLRGLKRQRGSSGLQSYYRTKISSTIGWKEGEFNRLLEIKKREMKRELEDLELE